MSGPVEPVLIKIIILTQGLEEFANVESDQRILHMSHYHFIHGLLSPSSVPQTDDLVASRPDGVGTHFS